MRYLTIPLIGLMTSLAIAAEAPDDPAQTTPCGYARIEGVITSIDAEAMQLAIGETTVQVTADTTIRAGRNLLLSFSDLEVGKTVAVAGTMADDGLTAVRINVRFTGRGIADFGLTAGSRGWRAQPGQGWGMGRMAGWRRYGRGGEGANWYGYGRGNRGRGWTDGNRPRRGWRGWDPGAPGGQAWPCRALALPPAEGGALDEATQAALRSALLNEYANESYYKAMVDKFGSLRPHSRIIRGQKRHTNALLSLFNRYGVEPPTQTEVSVPALPSTLQEAIQLAINKEKATIAMFDELLESVTSQDVKFVFTNLRNGSANRRIPCLERWAP